MACGCFPVAGDLESIREWIKDGRNGLLVDPGDPQKLAKAILRGLKEDALREQARIENLVIIAERAEYGMVMSKAQELYQSVKRG
jgi:glycosyltransferase involved in cell wall biosynthesis